MLCVEDLLSALDWADYVGGLPGLVARSEANLQAVKAFVESSDWCDFLCADPANLSSTSICLKISDADIMALPAEEQSAFAKAMTVKLADAGVAYDIGGYRTAPPGLRVWGSNGRSRRYGRSLCHGSTGRLAKCAQSRRNRKKKMIKVLISDKLAPEAIDIFKEAGIEVDFKPGLSLEELGDIIGEYDGLAIRSATKVTPELLAKADKLKVVGRAGIGVDNVDLTAATNAGVVVMNTPFGNAVTTAEHAISMLLALARQIPQAHASTIASKWEKSKFMGTEITGKRLGIIGCGNIGAIVAERAQGLKMKVMGYDPFLTEERAKSLGIEKVELDVLLARADFISLHTPLTDATRNIISADAINKMKKGVRIVNCARGGLVDELALLAALNAGHVAGAALDVFETEPAKNNPLFEAENFIATPHLGASTTEAQEKVALQVAEQMADYLTTGAVTNAINMASVSAEEAPILKPYMNLGALLGRFLGADRFTRAENHQAGI